MESYKFLIFNLLLVFCIGLLYSAVELLVLKLSLRSLTKTVWGWVYLLLNGCLGMIALYFSFANEINTHFLGAKIFLAGTSALALIRVILVPAKGKGEGNNAVSMIDVILKQVIREYDRERSNIDLKDIKRIMNGVDFDIAVDTLGILLITLLRTLEFEEQKKMKKDIELLKKTDEAKSIKHIILGCTLAEYVGVELLSKTVEEMREYLNAPVDDGSRAQPIGEQNSKQENLHSLIQKYR